MSDDTYPEELYVDEIDIWDYDDFFHWNEDGIPEPGEWNGEFLEIHEGGEPVDDRDIEPDDYYNDFFDNDDDN
jgi:hypothetical protein